MKITTSYGVSLPRWLIHSTSPIKVVLWRLKYIYSSIAIKLGPWTNVRQWQRGGPTIQRRCSRESFLNCKLLQLLLFYLHCHW